MIEIPLTKGKIAIVDDNFSYLNHYSWYVSGSGYAARKVELPRENGKRRRKTIYMHHMVLKPSMGLVTDHINHNRVDNRLSNLRITTISQNNRNVGLTSRNKSGYKGVSWCSQSKRWRAALYLNGKIQWKEFKDAKEAAMIYDKFMDTHFGEFAITNKKLGLV